MFNLKGKDGELLKELRGIRRALEVIALHFGRQDNRLFSLDSEQRVIEKSEDLDYFITDDADMLVRELKNAEKFKAEGFGKD